MEIYKGNTIVYEAESDQSTLSPSHNSVTLNTVCVNMKKQGIQAKDDTFLLTKQISVLQCIMYTCIHVYIYIYIYIYVAKSSH